MLSRAMFMDLGGFRQSGHEWEVRGYQGVLECTEQKMIAICHQVV